MRSDDLNALLTIATGVISIGLAVAFRDNKRCRTLKVYLVASGLFVLSAIVGITSSFHTCREGHAYYQWIIPSLGVFLVWIFVRHRNIRIVAGILLLMMGAVISNNFSSIVHEHGYTGNPINAVRERDLQIEACQSRNESGVDCPPPVTTNTFWHTWLTGIYRIEEIKTDE